MRSIPRRAVTLLLSAAMALPAALAAQKPDPRLERLKEEALVKVQDNQKMVQEIIDMLFSFGELGMQEFETQRYLTGLLADHGFQVQKGVAGMPTAWTARWTNGTGKPVIALGSDVDCIPQANQKPAVGYHEPIVAGAPGHGEGHNSGQAVNIVAALAVKEIMERENISGTLLIWPGIAEEQVASKAFYVRDHVFDGVDVNLFTHVGANFGVSWGQSGSNALWSVQFRFKGESAHAAAAPWRGRSALDAVMLMATAWEYHREHLEPASRSHYVIIDGGDQPNVVPQSAGIWFYFRERDYPRTRAMYEAAVRMAQGAALMTGAEIDTIQTVGSAWSGHFNKAIAEVTQANIERVGLPKWDEKDVELANALQRELGQEERGLADSIRPMRGPGGSRALARRRLGRHRRHLLEHADRGAELPVEHARRAGAQLGQRHRDGHTDCAQGRGRRREGAGAHAARHPPHAEARDGRLGLLQRRADQGAEVHGVHHGVGRARHLPERRDHGEVPAAHAALLLRSLEVRHLPRAARHHLPDGASEGDQPGRLVRR